jgi:membrane-associated phospholipid phosphatase
MRFQRLIPVLLLLPLATVAIAQAPDSVAAPRSPRRPTAIRWWQAGAALGGIAVTSLADNSLQHYIIDHRTQGEQDLADQWQKWGEGTIPVAVTLGTLGTGLILRKPAVTRTGGRLATSLVVVTLIGRGMKKAIGRSRPSEANDQYTFDPFGIPNSFPSGHTITGFAISTVLADASDNRWADIGFYTLAAGTGVARLVGNHHWFSDVVGGAVFGITTAKVVDGRWTLFGIHSPEFLTGPGRYGLKWTADIPALRGGAVPR